MSLARVQTPLLSLQPRVWCDGEHLYARDSVILRGLSLFSYDRLVHVDRAAEYVFVDTRHLWMLKNSRAIPFRNIEHLDYRFASMPTALHWRAGVTDQIETFTVELVLRGGERFSLFRFRGEGSVLTGWSGVLMGDGVHDLSGTQEDASRAYVELLQAYLGAPLGEPTPRLADPAGRTYGCTSCARPAPPRPGKCLYCGGTVTAE